MEKVTQDPATTKLEKLVQEIDRLEKEISAVRDKSLTLENEVRLEISQKNFLEVRKDNLTRSIEFYQNYSKKINTELQEKQAARLKLSMRSKYYDKLLEMYREKHLQQEKCNTFEDTSAWANDLSFHVLMDNLEKRKEKVGSNIEINSDTIKTLFKDLE